MNKVRIGIIGIGNIGSAHGKNIVDEKVKDTVLTAVCDIKKSRRDWAKKNLGESVAIFDNANEMMKSGLIDGVIVATPHYDHPKLVMEAFDHGLHALCEKPAGVYTKEVRKMNETAEKSGLVFAMMFNQRTNPLYRKMYDMVHSGDYGQIKRVNWIVTDWYRTQTYYDSGGWRATWDGEGGGVLLNQCPHNLDLLQWICGLPNKVHAYAHEGKWHNIEVEDDVTAYMEFENGATGVFITSTGDAPGTNRFEITMEKSKIVCENNQLSVYELEVNEREFMFSAKEGFVKPPGKYIDVEIQGEGKEHIGIMEAFAGKILRDEPLIAEGVEGINGLELSNAIHLSSWLGEAVTLPIDEDLFLEELNKKRAGSKVKKNVRDVNFDIEGSY